jgi:hypothetical protein
MKLDMLFFPTLFHFLGKSRTAYHALLKRCPSCMYISMYVCRKQPGPKNKPPWYLFGGVAGRVWDEAHEKDTPPKRYKKYIKNIMHVSYLRYLYHSDRK